MSQPVLHLSANCVKLLACRLEVVSSWSRLGEDSHEKSRGSTVETEVQEHAPKVVYSPGHLFAGLPLDQSSPDFSNQLNNVLYGKEYEQHVQNFQKDDLVWLVDYLDKVCPHVNFLACHSSQDRLSIVSTLPVPLPGNVFVNSEEYVGLIQCFQHPT